MIEAAASATPIAKFLTTGVPAGRNRLARGAISRLRVGVPLAIVIARGCAATGASRSVAATRAEQIGEARESWERLPDAGSGPD